MPGKALYELATIHLPLLIVAGTLLTAVSITLVRIFLKKWSSLHVVSIVLYLLESFVASGIIMWIDFGVFD